MAKIERVDADFKAFASESQVNERFVFGSDPTSPVMSDDLTANYTPEYLRGWQAGLSPSGFPYQQNFSSVNFISTQVMAYLHQMGIVEWNIKQEYPTNGGTTVHAGRLWVLSSTSLPSIGDEPTPDSIVWTLVPTLEEVGGDFLEIGNICPMLRLPMNQGII